jgi:hypothetical protein
MPSSAATQSNHRRILAALVVCAVLALLSCDKEEGVDKSTEELTRRLEQLRSVPYTSVTTEKVDPNRSGVVLHNPEKAYRGYNLVCKRLEIGAYLMTMDGEAVHGWVYPEEPSKYWMRAELLSNGDLIAIHKMRSIMRLDWNSNLRWHRRILAHHDLTIAPDSTIYIYTFGARKHRGLPALFESIVHLSSTGEQLRKWSTFEHIDHLKKTLDTRSFLDTILDSLEAAGISPDSVAERPDELRLVRSPGKTAIMDYFHANTLVILKETPLARKDDRFKAGNLLICFRNVNQIAVMDPARMEVLWSWGEGILEWPHHPTMLENGHILIYDNGTERQYTRILELDPHTEEIVWEYDGGPDNRFFSPTKGSAQRLPNGNTLICDADNGRVIEVTMDGEIVWEWLNPELKEGHRAQLYRMIRYPPEMVEPLLRELGPNHGEVAGAAPADAG